jgi:hypothetical protein
MGRRYFERRLALSRPMLALRLQGGDVDASQLGRFTDGFATVPGLARKQCRRWFVRGAVTIVARQFRAIVGLVAKNAPSVDFCGYWQQAIIS